MLGIDPNTQRDRMAEALDVILRFFRGEIVTEKTDWYTFVNARAHLRAVYTSRIPRSRWSARSRRPAAGWPASTTSA